MPTEPRENSLTYCDAMLLCARSKDINPFYRGETVRLFSVSSRSDFHSNELLALNKLSFGFQRISSMYFANV